MRSDYQHPYIPPLSLALGYISAAFSPMPRFAGCIADGQSRINLRSTGPSTGDPFRFSVVAYFGWRMRSEPNSETHRGERLFAAILEAEGFTQCAKTYEMCSYPETCLARLPDDFSSHKLLTISDRLMDHLKQIDLAATSEGAA